MSKNSTINGAAFQMDYGADYILEKYKSDGYEVQKLSFDDEGNDGRLVQIRNTSEGVGSKLKALVGLKTCATLKLLQKGGDLEVEVFGGSWLDIQSFQATTSLLIKQEKARHERLRGVGS